MFDMFVADIWTKWVLKMDGLSIFHKIDRSPLAQFDNLLWPVVAFKHQPVWVQQGLSMHLMDVVTINLYGLLDLDIYMKMPQGFDIPNKNHSRNMMYYIKLQNLLHSLN